MAKIPDQSVALFALGSKKRQHQKSVNVIDLTDVRTILTILGSKSAATRPRVIRPRSMFLSASSFTNERLMPQCESFRPHVQVG
jgi:hypothetical protein